MANKEYKVISGYSEQGGTLKIPLSWDINSPEKDLLVYIVGTDGKPKVCDYWTWDSANSQVCIENKENFAAFGAYVFRNELVGVLAKLTSGGQLRASDFMEQLGNLVRCSEQLAENDKHSIVSVDSMGGVLPEASSRAGKVLSFDEKGNPIVSVEQDDITNIKAYKNAAETAKDEAIVAKEGIEAAQTACETAKTAAQASADKAKASETKVEQSAQAAAVNAQAAEFSKSYAESYANTAQTAATTAEQEATSANVARDDAYLAQVGAENARHAAVEANTQAQVAKQAAIDAANTATQAAGIQAIRQEMLAKGYLHCTAGGYATGSFTGADVLSVVFKTNADFSSRADDNILSFFLLGVYQNGFDMQLGDDHVCRLRRNSSGFRSFAQTAVAAKATNEINIVCAVFKKLEDGNADGTLYVNGSVISPMTTTEGVYPTFGNKYYVNNVSGTQGGRTKTYVGYQDFMIFNFDIFAEGAPYSYADYANGKLVPFALKDTTATNRALLILENYTILNGSSRFIPDVSGNGQDATVGTNYGGTISGDVDVSIAKLKEYLTANS